MDETIGRENAQLRIIGAETIDHTVPVDVLVRTLQGLQQTAIFLEASTQQRPVERLFRPSEELRRRCQLRCGPIASGSVAVLLSVAQPEPNVPREATVQSILQRLIHFVGAAAQGDRDTLNRICPDSRFRDRALRETLSYLPRSGQRWGIEITNSLKTPIRLDQQTRRTVED